MPQSDRHSAKPYLTQNSRKSTSNLTDLGVLRVDENKQRLQAERAPRGESDIDGVGKDGTLLRGASWQSVRRATAAISLSRTTLGRASWSERGRRHRRDWPNRRSRAAGVRRPIPGRFASALGAISPRALQFETDRRLKIRI